MNPGSELSFPLLSGPLATVTCVAVQYRATALLHLFLGFCRAFRLHRRCRSYTAIAEVSHLAFRAI